MNSKEPITISSEVLRAFCEAALKSRNVRQDVVDHVSTSLLQTSLRGVDSHGIELLPHYVNALDAGRINPSPSYKWEKKSASTEVLDADHAFGHAAGGEAMLRAVKTAKEVGIAAVAVKNSTHFGAAAYFSLLAAEQDLIGLSFTHADSLMLSFRGTRPFFGTNPICLAAPVADEEPFCLDMATSLVSWNKILRSRNAQEQVPDNWGCDVNGSPVTDPYEIRSLMPIGNYKGFGLSMMVEILCGILTGMPYGRNIIRMYADPIEAKRLLGHFYVAIDINSFIDLKLFKDNLQAMMNELRQEPVQEIGKPVLVPGDPEKQEFSRRSKQGIPVAQTAFENFKKLAKETDFGNLI
jgi:ureidoglycolate dehydrogenase (NAD+)